MLDANARLIDQSVRFLAPTIESLGYGIDDVRQEASVAVWRASASLDPSRNSGDRRGFLRAAIRNHLANLHARAFSDRHCATTQFGQPVLVTLEELDGVGSGVLPDWFAGPATPEEIVSHQEVVQKLLTELPEDDLELLMIDAVEGAHDAKRNRLGSRTKLGQIRLSLARAHAATIFNRICDTEGVMPTFDLPECHADGEEPQGYDKEDSTCHQCPDKFSCLPVALRKGLIKGAVRDDIEVEEFVQAKGVPDREAVRAKMLGRMKRRLGLIRANGSIPEDLLTRAPLLLKERRTTEPPVELPPAIPEAKPVPREEPAKIEAKPETKLRVEPKSGVRRKLPPRGNGNPRRETMSNGKRLPPVHSASEEAMRKALARIKIGQPFTLTPGMALVRKRRNGEETVIKIRPDGFECNGSLYSSLSTAIMYVEKRVVSGNAFFHLNMHKCTEIRDEKGKTLAGFTLYQQAQEALSA